jgi:hypothetical protein
MAGDLVRSKSGMTHLRLDRESASQLDRKNRGGHAFCSGGYRIGGLDSVGSLPRSEAAVRELARARTAELRAPAPSSQRCWYAT